MLIVSVLARAIAKVPQLRLAIAGKGSELEQLLGLRDERVDTRLAFERLDRQIDGPLAIVVAPGLDGPAHHESRRAEHDQRGDRRDLREGDELELGLDQVEEELMEHMPSLPAI